MQQHKERFHKTLLLNYLNCSKAYFESRTDVKMTSAANLYKSVIDDVVANVRDAFQVSKPLIVSSINELFNT